MMAVISPVRVSEHLPETSYQAEQRHFAALARQAQADTAAARASRLRHLVAKGVARLCARGGVPQKA